MIRSRRFPKVPMVPLPPKVVHETTAPSTGDVSGLGETVGSRVQGTLQVPFALGGFARVLPITTEPEAADGSTEIDAETAAISATVPIPKIRVTVPLL